jgi:hypothetical protein
MRPAMRPVTISTMNNKNIGVKIWEEIWEEIREEILVLKRL